MFVPLKHYVWVELIRTNEGLHVHLKVHNGEPLYSYCEQLVKQTLQNTAARSAQKNSIVSCVDNLAPQLVLYSRPVNIISYIILNVVVKVTYAVYPTITSFHPFLVRSQHIFLYYEQSTMHNGPQFRCSGKISSPSEVEYRSVVHN